VERFTYQAPSNRVEQYARANHVAQFFERLSWIAVPIFHRNGQLENVASEVKGNGVDPKGDVHEVERSVEILQEMVIRTLQIDIEVV